MAGEITIFMLGVTSLAGYSSLGCRGIGLEVEGLVMEKRMEQRFGFTGRFKGTFLLQTSRSHEGI